MTSHRVVGGGGTQLHVIETGNPNGRPILFIHGFSQCRLAWSRQLTSDLANDFRLVAMDLRGHGLSDKPQEGYSDSKLWAEDLNAVIQTLDLDHPVLSGWSYGPLVILDYIRYYGEDAIAGIHFVGAVTNLGSPEATSFLSPKFLDLIPGFFSTDTEQSVASLEALLRMCFATAASDEDLYLMLGYSVSVPPYVRKGLFVRSVDNEDLLPKIRKPVLITHGSADAVVKPAITEQQKARIAHAQIQLVPNAGHAPFWDDAAAFNRGLKGFCQRSAALTTSGL
jgi:non-heme chloroperoxidase